MALMVHAWLGLTFISRSSVDLDLVWASSLILIGGIALMTGLISAPGMVEVLRAAAAHEVVYTELCRQGILKPSLFERQQRSLPGLASTKVILRASVSSTLGFRDPSAPKESVEIRSRDRRKCPMKPSPGAPHQVTQSQQVWRISARRERILAVSEWAQCAAIRSTLENNEQFSPPERVEKGLCREVGGGRDANSGC